jgi:hypothetical protein
LIGGDPPLGQQAIAKERDAARSWLGFIGLARSIDRKSRVFILISSTLRYRSGITRGFGMPRGPGAGDQGELVATSMWNGKSPIPRSDACELTRKIGQPLGNELHHFAFALNLVVDANHAAGIS